MLDQNLLERLPSDPEDAFSVFEVEMRKTIPQPEIYENNDEQRHRDHIRADLAKEYVIALAAFSDVHSFDMGVNFDELFELDGYEFLDQFNIASRKIQFFSTKCAIKLAQRKKEGSTCIYVLEKSSKIKIQKYIDKIRELILSANLTDAKKDALLSRLNTFGLEVDRDRTRLEAFTSFYVKFKSEAKDIVEIAETVEKIWRTVSTGGTELWKALPNLTVKGLLDAPPKKIEDQSSQKVNLTEEDDIPF